MEVVQFLIVFTFLLATVQGRFTTNDDEVAPGRRLLKNPTQRRSLRYDQLTDMMEHYNSDFDERKYWTYGCNCLILGDRPISDPGHGPPVDALDTVCKQYKDCLKCARQTHGDMCIGEFVRYTYGEKNGNKVCKDNAGSCERALCECDLQFAKNHVAKKDVFDKEYHLFWSTTEWDPKATGSCPTGGSGPYDPQCCGKSNGPFFLYNANTKSCCNGSVQGMGDICDKH